jgi:antitoxin component YwqK of YwqJK toxin-antitoxin module
MVGCGGGDEAPPAGEAALPATPENAQAKVDEPPVQTVDASKLVRRDGLRYEGGSEAPFTGVGVVKNENGHKWSETTYKDGKLDGLSTGWHKNGLKWYEQPYKDGKREGLWTMWWNNGQKQWEETYKNGKPVGLSTHWHENGQKMREATYKNGKLVSKTEWDEEGNEIKE